MKKIIIFILIVCVLLAAVQVFLFWELKEPTNESTFTELSITDEAVQELYEKANPSEDYDTMQDVYARGNFSNQFILGTAIVSILRNNPQDTVSESDVNVAIKQIFGTITYAHESGYIISDEVCGFQYDKNAHLYTILKGCQKNGDSKLLRKITSARKSDTEYIITEKLIASETTYDELNQTYTITVYDDIGKSHQIETLTYMEGEDVPVVEIEDYIEQASTYEYHFVFDGETFIYKAIEKVS